MSGPAAEPGLKELMHFSIVAIVTWRGSTDMSGGDGIHRYVGEGGWRSQRASSVLLSKGATILSEHKTRTAPETSPSDNFLTTQDFSL